MTKRKQTGYNIGDLGRLSDMDQALSGLKDFAFVLREYYKGLVESGFSEEQAIKFSIAWQDSVYRKSQEK